MTAKEGHLRHVYGFGLCQGTPLTARLNRLRKKSEQQLPRGLKAARDGKKKRLIGTTEVVP
ncbi:MAG: hypothetical protein ABSE85_13580 [Candidatus Korobacteraceae bacterium]